jgi:uncharacterized membrane protein
MQAASGSAQRLEETASALRKGPAESRSVRRQNFWIARVLLTVAIVTASYLAHYSLSGRALPGCRPEDGCSDALSSAWANWFGLPVSVPAIALYAALLALTFAVEQKLRRAIKRRLWLASLALASIVIAAAIWFVGLQAFVVEQWCRWCMATHLLASVAAGLVIHRARCASRPARPRVPLLSATELKWGAAASAALGGVLLAGGQLASSPPTPPAASVVSSGSDTPALAASTKFIVLHDGRFKLNAAELPMLGPARAGTILVGLFDYTCHHCRETRRVIKKAIERASGRLAIVSLPMPLDASCNPLVTRTPEEHAHACEYARLGLGVFRAQPAAFREFDDWMFDPIDPPRIEQARAKANSLAGAQALERALGDPWIDERLASSVALYEANAHASRGDTRLPQIVIGDTLVSGTIGTADELFQLLARHASGGG